MSFPGVPRWYVEPAGCRVCHAPPRYIQTQRDGFRGGVVGWPRGGGGGKGEGRWEEVGGGGGVEGGGGEGGGGGGGRRVLIGEASAVNDRADP